MKQANRSVDPFDPVVKVAMRERSSYADFTYCINCEQFMLVNLGEETCPLCNSTGTLAWVDGQPQEVEITDFDYLSRNIYAEMMRTS